MAKIIIEGVDSRKMRDHLSKFGYKFKHDLRGGPGGSVSIFHHPDGHSVVLSNYGDEWTHNKHNTNHEKTGHGPDDLHDHLMSIHPYYHGRGN